MEQTPAGLAFGVHRVLPSYRLRIILTLVITEVIIILTAPILSNFSPTDVHHVTRNHYFAGIAMLLAGASSLSFYFLSRLVVLRAPVSDIRTSIALRERYLPHFTSQRPNSESLVRFRELLGAILKKEYIDSLSKVTEIRQWVRRQQSQDARVWLIRETKNHEDPHRLLAEQKDGKPGSCRRFSYIFLGALLSAGFEARIVSFASSLDRWKAKRHVGVEVWIDELEKWVFVDPTCDTTVRVQGTPASAIEVLEAVTDGHVDALSFDRNGTMLEPHPTIDLYAMCCRHMFVATTNAVFDGYSVRMFGTNRIGFLHYSKESTYPQSRKRVLLATAASGLFLSTMFWALELV